MSVVNGQIANQTTFNTAFMSRTAAGTSTAAIVSLVNVAIASGASVNNVQALLNKLIEGIGTTGELDATINDYASNNYVTDGSSRKQAIELLDTQIFNTQTDLDAAEASIVVIENEVDDIGGNVYSFNGAKTFTENVTINGDLNVLGTTYTQNELEVTDTNITVNKGGSDATAEGSGVTVDRVGTKGSFVYQNSLASRFKAGGLGAEAEVVTVSHAQTLTNKIISGSSNSITNVSLTAGVAGALPIANGGTGQTAQTSAFDSLSPLTTKGDLIINDGTNDVRLPVGTDNYVLTADSTQASGAKWAAVSGGAANAFYAHYQSQTGQSIPTATATIIDCATLVEESAALVTTGAGWKFTSNSTMRVFVHATAMLEGFTGWSDTEPVELLLYKNGSFYRSLDYKMSFGSASNVNLTVNGGAFVSLVNTDFIDIRITQSSGSAINLLPASGYNHITIFRVD